MQLTRAADYAVRVMIHLAGQPEVAVVSKTLLAKAAEAPESFLSKILQSLARAELIQTRRGVAGGFSLLPRGARASLLDVVEAIDGPIALNVCVTSGVSCHRHAECPAHKVWLRAQSAMLSVLRDAKIAEMIPERESRRALFHIAQVTGSVKEESKELSRQGELKSGTKARTHSTPTRVVRKANRNQNIKN